MPKITPSSAPRPMSVLGYDGTNFYVLKTDGDGHLQIDALSTALPTDAATDTVLQAVRDRIGALTTPAAGSVNKLLTDMLTALQLIDNLYNALHSVNTDELVVRGEDQLISHRANLTASRSAVISGAGGYVASVAVPAGEIWKVTNIAAVDVTTATTAHNRRVRSGGASYIIENDVAAYGAGAVSDLQGEWWLDPTDEIWVYFVGGLAGDTCEVHLMGLIMTLES